MKLPEKKIRELIEITGRASSSNSLYGKCPYCNHNEFGISLDKNHPFNCFRKKNCGVTGNIYDLLKHLGKAVEFIKEERLLTLERINIETEELKIDFKDYKLPIGYRRVFDNEYLNNRGFIPQDYEKYEVGISKIMFKGYVIFPVKYENKYIGHVARSIYPKDYCEQHGIKRYLNSISNLANTIYGKPEEHTIICEGIFDQIATEKKLSSKLDRLGCVCTFGAKISENQINLLKKANCKIVYLALDADVPKQIEKLGKELAQHFIVKIVQLPEKDGVFKDPDECSELELEESFINSKSFLNFGKIKRF